MVSLGDICFDSSPVQYIQQTQICKAGPCFRVVECTNVLQCCSVEYSPHCNENVDYTYQAQLAFYQYNQPKQLCANTPNMLLKGDYLHIVICWQRQRNQQTILVCLSHRGKRLQRYQQGRPSPFVPINFHSYPKLYMCTLPSPCFLCFGVYRFCVLFLLTPCNSTYHDHDDDEL